MIRLNLDILGSEIRKAYEKDMAIKCLEDYFTFGKVTPKEVLFSKPYLAKKAINLLNQIKELTGEEYTFVRIQCLPFTGISCSPYPINYDPQDAVNHVLGRYDRQYFVDFLAQN
ncbi:MAG: hypothetical protein Q8R18_04500 [bacterium]|nr:hypothetical protein [bacterium]